jgi:hypothetical protein
VTSLLGWLKKRASPPREVRQVYAAPPQPAGRAMTGKYLRLHTYLKNRYANTVVLTFAQIEDLLGFALPGEASHEIDWWMTTAADAREHTDAWTLANRTATVNLAARVVVFDNP